MDRVIFLLAEKNPIVISELKEDFRIKNNEEIRRINAYLALGPKLVFKL